MANQWKRGRLLVGVAAVAVASLTLAGCGGSSGGGSSSGNSRGPITFVTEPETPETSAAPMPWIAYAPALPRHSPLATYAAIVSSDSVAIATSLATSRSWSIVRSSSRWTT